MLEGESRSCFVTQVLIQSSDSFWQEGGPVSPDGSDQGLVPSLCLHGDSERGERSEVRLGVQGKAARLQKFTNFFV